MRKFAVFDIDGTLFRFALFHSIVDKLIIKQFFSQQDVLKIEEGRKIWKSRQHPEAFWDYVTPSVDIYLEALPNIDLTKHSKIVQEVFEEEKNHVYAYTRDLIKKLKGQGYFLIAISGSQEEIVERFAKYYGFDTWVGTQYEVKNGKFTGDIRGAYKDKHKILNKIIEENSLSKNDSIAVGDTDSDVSMLEVVSDPIAFNPNAQLLKYAQNNSWKIVIERKNVIYELEQQDGSYVLA